MIPRLKFHHTSLAWTIFRWTAFAIMISMWSESAVAFVPVAKISNPPATINIVVNNLANYIETGGVRSKLIDGWDGKAEMLARMEHLLSIEQFSNSMFVSGIMGIKATFAMNRHSMSWGVPIVFDRDFQLISERRNITRLTHPGWEPSSALITNKENIVSGNVGTQFLSSSFFGTFDQITGRPPQSERGEKQQSCKGSHRICPDFVPPIFIWLFFAVLCMTCINWTANLGDDALRYGFKFRSLVWYGLCGLFWIGMGYLLFFDGICSLWSLL